jgi:hypothetical protein
MNTSFTSFKASSQIILGLSTILPNSTNLLAGILIWAFAASLIALDGYTFMYFAQMAAEVELDTFRAASHAINALRRNLVGVIHFAPFLRNLDAHLVIVLNSGNTSLTGLAVNTTAGNHLIHIIFIVFCNSSKNRAACEPSIWA